MVEAAADILALAEPEGTAPAANTAAAVEAAERLDREERADDLYQIQAPLIPEHRKSAAAEADTVEQAEISEKAGSVMGPEVEKGRAIPEVLAAEAEASTSGTAQGPEPQEPVRLESVLFPGMRGRENDIHHL